ncbi:MAG: tripartite tricarboxylate transporter substrate binding protein [Alcaligenaceae bacterium]|nr:tripartite tricarboxylate transporter substrate binding protein [Alcaligenaceae bacterium SAGV5]MPS53993.1 tripartite tricarboxylate transporter substrate binding protein [Alcaligenaceae bacterium SAGV3]MPT59314.1 tripartite tricarboxylate transporter substrate binding protein [Alcaligenaceae bacterium]
MIVDDYLDAARAGIVRRTLAFMAVLFAALSVLPAQAQETFPSHPLRIVVPFPVGGPVDVVSRKIAQQLSQRLGQPVVVDNRPGANTILGADLVAKAPADGYTMLVTNTGVVQNPWLYARLPYDLESDLLPVAQILEAPLLLAANGTLPYGDVAGLLDHERSQRGKTAFGSTSVGGTTHIYGEQLKRVGKLDTVHVPYKGDPPALQDLLGNRIQWYFATASQAAKFVANGRLKALGVTGTRRLASLPDVPTMAQAGLPGFETVAWYGVFLPAKTPRPVADRLEKELVAIVRGPELTAFMVDNMFSPAPLDAAAFGSVVQDSLAKWRDLIQGNGIRLE